MSKKRGISQNNKSRKLLPKRGNHESVNQDNQELPGVLKELLLPKVMRLRLIRQLEGHQRLLNSKM